MIILCRFYWFDSFVDKRCSFVRQRTSTIFRVKNQQYDKSKIFSIMANVPKRIFADNLCQPLIPKTHYTLFIKVLIGCMAEIENVKIDSMQLHLNRGFTM